MTDDNEQKISTQMRTDRFMQGVNGSMWIHDIIMPTCLACETVTD